MSCGEKTRIHQRLLREIVLAPGAPVVGHGQVHHIGEARRLHSQGLVQHRNRSQAVQIRWGLQGGVPRLCGQTRGSPKQSTSRGRPSGRPRSRRAACSPTHSACPRTSASASACPPAKQTTSSGVTKRGPSIRAIAHLGVEKREHLHTRRHRQDALCCSKQATPSGTGVRRIQQMQCRTVVVGRVLVHDELHPQLVQLIVGLHGSAVRRVRGTGVVLARHRARVVHAVHLPPSSESEHDEWGGCARMAEVLTRRLNCAS